jgi:hypothetical protein
MKEENKTVKPNKLLVRVFGPLQEHQYRLFEFNMLQNL